MARLLNPTSAPCAPTNICIFDTPDSQIAFQKGSWLSFVPAFNVDNNGPFIFHVQDSSHFLQLNKLYVSFKLQLNYLPKNPGDDVTSMFGTIAPANLIGCSFFNQVKVAFNNVMLHDSTHYAYKSYIQTLFGSKMEHKKSVLGAAGWAQDDADHDIESADNQGFKRRCKMLKSGVMSVCAPILLEPFMTEKLLIPHVNMQLTLYRNTDAFVMESKTDQPFSLSITDLRLHVRAIEVAPAAALAIENRLRTVPARYPYTGIKVKVLSVPAGRLDMPLTTLYSDVIPRKVLVGLVDPEAMEGKLTKNCFNFAHYDVSEIFVEAGGARYPNQPYRCHFADNQYAESFVNMFEELGCLTSDCCPEIDYRQFGKGFAFFAFNLSPLDNGNAWELVRNGSTQIQIRFGKKTPASLNVVVFSFYDSCWLIDSFRNVSTENQI